jgi:hypothetical protein
VVLMNDGPVSDLEKFFKNNNGKTLIHKYVHYFDIYDRHFGRFRNEEIIILEIGISQGGSLQMWKDYFGPKAKIYGVDINPQCKELEEENIEIFIGSQSDRKFLRDIRSKIPQVDILIDDGGHTMIQQIVTFEELFDHVKADGVYLCEDLHTSYWPAFGGGYRRMGTFIEYSKRFIDQLNAWHSKQWMLKANSFTTSVDSIHYYDSVLVIEKRSREKPFHEERGTASFINTKLAFGPKLKHSIVKRLNAVLAFFRLPSL